MGDAAVQGLPLSSKGCSIQWAFLVPEKEENYHSKLPTELTLQCYKEKTPTRKQTARIDWNKTWLIINVDVRGECSRPISDVMLHISNMISWIMEDLS